MSQFLCFPCEFNVNSIRHDVGYNFEDNIKCSSLNVNIMNASNEQLTG